MIDKKEIIYFDRASHHFGNGVILDIGAHTGSWSNRITLNKKIYCFEPHPRAFEVLCKNKNVIAINKGVGDKNEFKTFNYIPNNPTGSGFVTRGIFKDFYTEQSDFEIVTIDDTIKEPIDFAKVDTEGYELEVLKGMENHLKNGTVNFVQVEYGGTYLDRGISLNDIIRYVNQFAYNVYDYNKRFYIVRKFRDNYVYNNLLITKKVLRW